MCSIVVVYRAEGRGRDVVARDSGYALFAIVCLGQIIYETREGMAIEDSRVLLCDVRTCAFMCIIHATGEP